MLDVKDFNAVATDEIIAEINLWNQKVTVVLCIELDEDEEDEKLQGNQTVMRSVRMKSPRTVTVSGVSALVASLSAA